MFQHLNQFFSDADFVPDKEQTPLRSRGRHEDEEGAIR